MKRRLFIFSVLICLFSIKTFAQSKRFSADFHGGMPYALTSITSKASTFGGVGLRYNLSREISIQGLMEVGTLAGKQKVEVILDPDQSANYISFTNNFFSYTANIQLNLDKALKLRKHLKRFNPYFVVGTGFMQSNVTSVRADYKTRHYNQNFYMSFSGLIGRYYVSPEIDLTFGINYYYSQTPFIDGIPLDKVNDSYFLSHVGITYKIGARTDKQHIEWINVILPKKPIRSRKVPKTIENKPEAVTVSEPEDEEMLIVFYRNKIKRIQFENNQLEKENARQMEEINQFRKDLDSMQEVVKGLKSQIEQLNNSRSNIAFVAPVVPLPEIIRGVTKKEIRYVLKSSPTPKRIKIPESPVTEKLKVAALPSVSKNEAAAMKPGITANPILPTIQPIATENKATPPDSAITAIAIAPKQTYKPPTATQTPPTIIESTRMNTGEITRELKEIPAKKTDPKPIAVKKQQVQPGDESIKTLASDSVTAGGHLQTRAVTYVITSPPHRYNLIVGAYKSRKYALILMNKLNLKGYDASVYRRNPASKILRVTILSTDDRTEAIRSMKKARREIDAGAWIQVY